MDLKERVIEAVINEFNENGLKFTMDDIAKRIGISKRTLYMIVNDKETLLIEAINHCFSAMKENEQIILSDETMDLVEKINKVLAVLPLKYETLELSQLYQLKNKYPKIYAKIEYRLETGWEAVIDLLRQGIQTGRIRNINLTVFQAMVNGTIEHFLSHRNLKENNIPYLQARQEMIRIILEGIVIREDDNEK
ncbi:MAG: transcriptional regulator, TetR family [Herbinix sp.]|jgi:AcrR family transcriptional regulator|nr:transcriptional regulator, TetR family [Herbinix sp.]